MTDPAVRIRLFSEEDADATASLIRRTLITSNAADYDLRVLEGLADWYGAAGLRSRVQHATRWVAEDDGEIIGTAAHRDGRLEGLFVAPERQGGGVGAALLAVVEAAASAAGHAVLRLDSSRTAVGFYRRCGYAAEAPEYDAGEGPVTPMVRDLAPVDRGPVAR